MTTTTEAVELLRNLTPMLAETCEVDLSTLVGTHVFDQKLDGIRALIATGLSEVYIRNRNGRDLTANYPELQAGATFALPEGVVIDGEITAVEGTFSEIAARDRIRGAGVTTAMQEIPAQYTAFDILRHPDHGDVRHWPYGDRRALLESLGLSLGMHNFHESLVSPDPAFYERIKILGGEGVVAKRLTGKYGKGRKKDWLKYKAKRTVSCVVVGYEPGREGGSREDCGAFLLSMVDDDGASATHVGKVGSGFTLDEVAVLKREIDNSRLPVIEVEVLGRTKNDKLRQPVYKGLRTDIYIHDVRINQLNALPRG